MICSAGHLRARDTLTPLRRLFVVATSVALFASTAVAEGGGHGAGHEPSIADLSWFWVNFAVYVSLLYVALRKPLAHGWASRRTRIADEVSSATSEMAAAERELAAVEALTKNLPKEQERARAEILKQGELEASGITTAASEKAVRIKSQVKELLDGESRSAEIAFRQGLIAKAVELSKARFVKGDYASRQSAYVDAAIDRAKRLVR